MTIRIKRRSSGSVQVLLLVSSRRGLAFNENDAGNGILYIGIGAGGAGGSASSVVAIGGDGAYCTPGGGTQTISGAKTFSSTVALGGSATATTPSSGDDGTSVATTAYVQGEGFLTGNEAVTISGDISGSGTTSVTGTLATVNGFACFDLWRNGQRQGHHCYLRHCKHRTGTVSCPHQNQ